VYLTSGISYVIGTGASIFALILCFAFPACCLLLLLVAAGALGVVTQHKKVAVAAWVLWGLFVLLWTTAVTGFQADMHLFFVAYRMLQPSSGVSPGTPVVFLVVIAFAWAFTQFSREAGTGIPDVPDLDEPLADARRLNVWLMSSFPLAYVSYALLGAVFLIWVRVRGVEGQWYDWLMDLGISFGYFLMLSTWWQLIVCWRHLRRFLEALERHVMRDAFSRLPKELAPLPLVRRGRQKPYLLAAYRCRDTLDAILSSEMSNDDPLRPKLDARRTAMRDEIKCLLHLNASEKSEDPFEYDEIENLRTTIGDRILDTANLLVTRAREMFWKEGKSESLEVEQRQRNGKETLAEQQKQRILAEEFIALRFVMYLVFVLDQMRRLMWFVVISFVLIMVAQNVYPFESPRVIDFTSLTIFGIVGIGTTFVLAQMDRDAILSRLTATQPNAIGKNFFIRLVSFGALPLVSVLATQFPSIRNFLFSWIQPALQALTSSG
jgi:hypothetical protein